MDIEIVAGESFSGNPANQLANIKVTVTAKVFLVGNELFQFVYFRSSV